MSHPRFEVSSSPSLPEANRYSSSRRKFLRTLATASAVVGAASAGAKIPVSADNQSEAIPAHGLDDLRRWVAAGSNWQTIREYFLLDPAITHLNTGSLGASPRVVVEAHARFLRELEANPVHNLFGSMGEKMEIVRRQAADYLGANLDEVMLTANTTSGMNLVAAALRLQPGDEVLTSNQEHAGGKVCWENERSRSGVAIREFDLNAVKSAADILQTIQAGITPRTRVLSLSQVSTISGVRLPVAAISKLARERGVFLIVDGAQSAGMLDVNLRELGCDAFATSGHKWMLAPKGTGILYLRKEFQSQLSDVLLKSGLNAYTAASGTRNVPQILAQGTAIDFLNTIGRQQIEKRNLELAGLLRQQLAEVAGVEIVSPVHPELQSAMITIKLPEKAGGQSGVALSSSSVYQTLFDKHQLVVKSVPGEHLQGRGIRISTHFYNAKKDVEFFTQALKLIVEKGQVR